MRVVMFTYWNNCWVEYLKKYFATKPDIDFRIVVSSQIQKDDMLWADVVIFGWANEAVIQLSKYFLKFAKRYIVFCRSYELFIGHTKKINWKHIDDLIFVNKAFYREHKDLPCNVHYLPNAIDLDKWKFQKHGPDGLKIAMVANLSHKKGIDLIPQFMYMVNERRTWPVELEPYTLHIAGIDQWPRHTNYVKYMLKQMKLDKIVKFYSKVDNIQEFLKDKDYLFTCSVTEGHPNNVMEAMSLGIKPLIHNWPGAKDQFPKDLIWTELEEAVDMVFDLDYNSEGYRKFIEDNYDMWKVYPKLEELVRR